MGNTLDYEYELEGDELTIWGGEKARRPTSGTFSADGNTNTGKWVYPDGGGYDSTMERIY